MAIGYACLQLGSDKTKFSTIHVKNYSEEKLIKIIENNLNALETIIKYNAIHNIKLFRISSDIIPLASHPINTTPWWDIFKSQLDYIGALIKNNNIRVSMHPAQFTVLNSPRDNVVQNSIKELQYHVKLLESLNCNYSSKIVIHIGGVYSNKKESINRFITNFKKLDEEIKKRLIIENDDKSYNIEDIIFISNIIHIPIVFDNLHHKLNPPPNNSLNEYQLIKECSDSWKISDGKQKIHYSQSANNYKTTAHSKTINTDQFLNFYNNLIDKDIDIMLEVKDKNLSAIKCNLLITDDKNIKYLEKEWAKYKYYILSCSPKNYDEIRNLLKDKNNYNAIKFYQLIDEALKTETKENIQLNTIYHIWGYFKKKVDAKEKKKFLKLLDNCNNNKTDITKIKNYLFKLTFKYSIEYLLDSLYFYL